MQSKERLLFFILPSFAILIFVLLVFAGAFSYEGGNRLDHNSIGYSFSNNYLSDLGRLRTVSGVANTIPYYCFNSGLIILSAVFSFYFYFSHHCMMIISGSKIFRVWEVYVVYLQVYVLLVLRIPLQTFFLLHISFLLIGFIG